MINETTAYDRIHLITVLHCNIHLAFKKNYKILFSFLKSIINKKS